jgi:hypothetical protein
MALVVADIKTTNVKIHDSRYAAAPKIRYPSAPRLAHVDHKLHCVCKMLHDIPMFFSLKILYYKNKQSNPKRFGIYAFDGRLGYANTSRRAPSTYRRLGWELLEDMHGPAPGAAVEGAPAGR